jgi:hypothetical protein
MSFNRSLWLICGSGSPVPEHTIRTFYGWVGNCARVCACDTPGEGAKRGARETEFWTRGKSQCALLNWPICCNNNSWERRQLCQTQCLLRAAWKRGDYSERYHMGGENHNSLFLIIPNLNLGYIFGSSIFPQAHTNVNFMEAHLHFMHLKYKSAVHK